MFEDTYNWISEKTSSVWASRPQWMGGPPPMTAGRRTRRNRVKRHRTGRKSNRL